MKHRTQRWYSLLLFVLVVFVWGCCRLLGKQTHVELESEVSRASSHEHPAEQWEEELEAHVPNAALPHLKHERWRQTEQHPSEERVLGRNPKLNASPPQLHHSVDLHSSVAERASAEQPSRTLIDRGGDHAQASRVSVTEGNTGVAPTTEELSDEVLAELMRETIDEHPAEDRGERPEWAKHTGIGLVVDLHRKL